MANSQSHHIQTMRRSLTTISAYNKREKNEMRLFCVRDDMDPLFRRSTIPTKPNPNPSTMASICTTDLRIFRI